MILNALFSAVAIIGGADGPTSIFIADSTGAWGYALIALIAVLILSAIFWAWRRK